MDYDYGIFWLGPTLSHVCGSQGVMSLHMVSCIWICSFVMSSYAPFLVFAESLAESRLWVTRSHVFTYGELYLDI